MSEREFHQLLSSLGALSPQQLAALRRELDLHTPPRAKTKPATGKSRKPATPATASVFDLLDQAGLIGCIKGKPGSPTDLATNAKHMEGFGRG